MPAEAPPPRLAALRQVLVVWGAELLLARISSEPQALADALESLVLLAAIGLPGVLLAERLRSPRPRRAAIALAALPPLLLVVLGILLPLFVRARPAVAALVVAGVTAALVAWRLVEARRSRPVTGPVGIAVVVAAAAAAVWIHDASEPPLLTVVAPLLVCLGLLAGLARSRRLLVPAAAAACILALLPERHASPRWTATGSPPEAPDVILIVVDTLRADAAREMESYQRLAAQGVEFRAAQAAAPWTTPSMGSVLTGMRVAEHGARRLEGERRMRRRKVSPDVPTLAERLSEVGYDTAGLVTHESAGEIGGFERGFAWWRDAEDDWALPRARSERRGRPTAARLLTELDLQGRPPSLDGRALTDRALAVLEHRRADRPLFLWLQFFDDHLPYRHLEDSSLPHRRRVDLERGNAVTLTTMPFWRSADGEALMREAYVFEVGFADAEIGRLLDHLGPPPERGRIVILTSDHGEEFWEHGELLHGHAMYQELLHVPLVVSGLPGREPGSVESRTVGHVDIAPTILAALGLPIEGLSGQDLARDVEIRPYVSENLAFHPSERLTAVRQGRFKLILEVGREPLLFDLEADPGETTSVASRHPEIVARLQASAERVAESPESDGVDVELSAEDLELLEALGYTE